MISFFETKLSWDVSLKLINAASSGTFDLMLPGVKSSWAVYTIDIKLVWTVPTTRNAFRRERQRVLLQERQSRTVPVSALLLRLLVHCQSDCREKPDDKVE